MSQTGMPFPDVTKLLEQLKVPGIDMQAIIDARRKDVEALTQANQMAYESMQALARREAEIVQQTISEWQAAMTAMAGKNPAEMASKGTELATQAFGKALANMRELAEMASRSQAQAYDILNRRFQENLEELRKMLQPK
ncbi:MAG: TIGR01841 family phasin [Betaproteobacteria bacterium]|nr:TIGR01841 family phasin [Betaproteobacteria bacterium]